MFAVTSGGAGLNIWFLDPSTNQWKNICGDIPKNLYTASICADWKKPTVLFVGTVRGVYRSTDLGLHWTVFGLNLPKTVITDLQTLPSAGILAAGTFGRGTWEILLTSKKKTPPKKDKTAPKKVVTPKLKPSPVAGSYFHVSDLNLLPGRLPGQRLVNPESRKNAKRK